MSGNNGRGIDPESEAGISKGEFDIKSLEDEVRVDGLCRELLKRFYLQLMEDGMSPEEATARADSADFYVRDFVIDRKRRNLFAEVPGIVRQFAGNWYIVSTMEPNIGQLSSHLVGIKAFYGFLLGHGLISGSFMEQIGRECDDTDYYDRRIESFWEIRGNGYEAWERECTIKEE